MSALASPSAHALDPGRPVGATALAIRQALPDFQDWNIDPGAAAERLFTLTASAEDRWRAMLPPGFADGQPGAYARASRGVLNMTRDERPQSMYELLQESDSPEKLRAAASRIFMTDVIDLVWMRSGPLDLRSVQDLLEHLGSAVLPGTHFRFSPYDEPRYRAALQLHGNGVAARLASGGVLAPWPGQPEGAEAAHVRLFLEPWTAIRLGGSS